MSHLSHIYTRRHFVATAAALATTLQLQRSAMAAGLASGAEVCTLSAEQEEGPYYVEDELVRSNILEGKPGIPLSLRILVLDARSCKPLANAAVDLWHCDAMGVYAGFTKQSMMGPGGPGGPGGPPPGFDPGSRQDFDARHGPPPGGMGGPPPSHPSDKLTFLRGIQLTGADGVVNFKSVFPGFYMGRTNHIHFKVRVGGTPGKTYAAGHTAHTGQIFFPEDVAVELMQHEPYSRHMIHRTTQAQDDVFGGQHGDGMIANLTALNSSGFAGGMHADVVASADPAATPAPAGRRGGPRYPPPHG